MATLLLLAWLALAPLTGWTAWWSSITIEAETNPADHIHYSRILLSKPDGQPVRAHIASVTGVGDHYIFGVLGSYGVLIQPSLIARNSEATVVINGGFFSVNPTRANGMVMAHGRLLYPPPGRAMYHGTVGFTPDEVLFDWIAPDVMAGNRFSDQFAAWNNCHAALGAGPMLVRDGRFRPRDLEGFNLDLIAPRSAIARQPSGQVLLVVVDGRQPGWSAGVTLQELAELLLHYKAHQALNLDGGGSSALVINNQVMNRPSDRALPGQPGRERAVANVIALFPKP